MPEKKLQDPPLVDLKVTNPITYIKKWWAKIIGNEGVDFRLHIHPLTAIVIAIIIASIGFGVGRFVFPFSIPFFEYKVEETKTPTPTITQEAVVKDTAFTGNLQFSENTNRYYLVTTSAEAITLKVPVNINLSALVGKRIFAAGKYDKSIRTLEVFDAKDMEVLPKSPIPIPTDTPTPTPTTMPSSTPSPEASATPLY